MTQGFITKVDFYDLPIGSPAGLASDGEVLWISGLESAEICEIDAHSGSVVRKFEAAVDRPLLLCADAENLWQYDEETMSLYRTSRAEGATFPFGSVGGGINSPFFGVASSGSHLWVLTPDFPYFSIKKSIIHKLELPWKLQEASFDAPSYGCRGLFYDGKYLWTLDDANSELYMFDPVKGTVINIIETPDLDLLGVAKTSDSIWSIDYRANRLCRMFVDDQVQFSLSRPRRSKIALTETFANLGPGRIKKWETVFPVPMDFINQKLLSEVSFSEEPLSWLKASWDNGEGRAAKFAFRDLQPADRRKLTATFDIETYDVRFYLYPDRVGSLEEIPEEIKDVYMLDRALQKTGGASKEVLAKIANLFQLQEKDLKKIVEEVVGDEENPYWIARKLYDHVIDKIEYILPYRNLPTNRIIDQEKGSCGNHAFLYSALCQLSDLPTRIVVGYGILRADGRLGSLDHAIPEVWFPK